MAKRQKSKISLFSVLFALALGFIIAYFDQLPPLDKATFDPDALTVHFLDVGQADCQIICLPAGKVMMIDAGNNDDSELITDYLDSLGIKKIDYLVGTHPHEDHIGSLDYVINNYDIGAIYMPEGTADTQTYLDVIDAIDSKGLAVTTTQSPMTIYSDEDTDISVVAPVKYFEAYNNRSIVIRLTYKDASFLFTGDAEEESESLITANIAADVLSVGHHGSSTSTSDYFLQRVDPMYAVISCGKYNDYGHPHYEILEKLRNNDITVYRTDFDGTLICSTKGVKGDYSWNTLK